MSANEATLEVFHGRKKLRAGTALCELDQFLEQCVKDDRYRVLMFESAQYGLRTKPGLSTKTLVSTELRIKLTTNIESTASTNAGIVQRLVKEERARNRIPAMLRRHPRCSRFISEPEISLDDLTEYQKLFAEVIGYLYDKTSYNRLFLEYEQLCFEDALEDLRVNKMLRLDQPIKDNPFRMFVRLFTEGDKFLENLCDWLRDQRFPLALYDRRQVDYLVGLLGQKKKKKSKKKNKKRGEQPSTAQNETQSDYELATIDPYYEETSKLQETLDGMTLLGYRIPCSFSADYLNRLMRQLPSSLLSPAQQL